tara:strand:- start:5564 stop:5836 length:273 start_codon:yes stop_codon:yes gene_type:complete
MESNSFGATSYLWFTHWYSHWLWLVHMKFKKHTSKAHVMPKPSRVDRIQRLQARLKLQRECLLPVVDVSYDNQNNVVEFTADTGWKTYKA